MIGYTTWEYSPFFRIHETPSTVATATSAALFPSREGPRSDGFRPTQVVPPFKPIVDAPFVAGDEGVVRGEEMVLGVAIKGEARAYPINMLTGPSREIINDTLGGVAIAATW